MKKTLWPTAVLAFLALAIAYGQAQSSAPARQAWEYKILIVNRVAESNSTFTIWQEVSADGAKALPGPVSTPTKLAELGNQGWELVAVTPMSNNAGGYTGLGSNDLAGFTSQLSYYFKRPK